jgi:Protein of unknown function (DUF3515)
LALSAESRRAALIATAITLPLIVLLALAFGASRSHKNASRPLGPVVVSTPVSVATAAADSCEKVIEKLPVKLDGMTPRVVHGSSAAVDTRFVVAWGSPPVILSCGVGRPAALKPGSAVELFGVGQGDHNSLVLATHTKSADVFAVVDRPVYISIEVPKSLNRDPVSVLAGLVAQALPSVCDAQATTGPPVPDAKLCTHRP